MTVTRRTGTSASYPAERNLCIDGDRLCAGPRQRQSRRDEQDYLARHNPRCSSLEMGLLMLLAALLLGAIATGLSRPAPQSDRAASAEVSEQRDAPHDRYEFGDDLDFHR